MKYVVIFLFLMSCATPYDRNDAKFNKRGHTAESYDDSIREYKNERNDLGIQSLSDNCNIKKANGLDLSNEIIRDLFCAKDKKEKIAFVFQIRCLSGESINYRPFFDNMVIEWKSILEQGKLRTDDRGKVRVSTLIYDVEDAILLKTKKFEKRISLKTGDYEVWLTAKECYE